jgi:hypothetical protein
MNDNKKPDFLILMVLAVSLVLIAGEAILFNYALLKNYSPGDGTISRLLFFIFYKPKFWMKGGLYFRGLFLTVCGAMAYVVTVTGIPDKKSYGPFIIAGVAMAYILLIRNIYEWATGPINLIVIDAAYLIAIFMFPFALLDIKRQLGEIEGYEFNQNKKLIETPTSINWKTVHGYVNVLNPFRGISIVGGPGAGKSYTLIEPIIEQLLLKNFTAFVYDFKFSTLGDFTYNVLLRKAREQGIKSVPKMFYINFLDVRYSHRCNPIRAQNLNNKALSDEVSTTVLFNLNRSWIQKRGFFEDSAIITFAAMIWWLKKYQDLTGKNVCSLPHAVVFATQLTEKIVPILMDDYEVKAAAAPINEALQKGAMEQLAGVMATLQNSVGKLNIKEMFWVMTESDFDLDINNPADPKVVVVGNDDQYKQVFAPALSLYASMISGKINQKGKLPCLFCVDEVPTIFIPKLDNLPNTGRSNKIATVLAMQDYGQLDRDYGKDEARVLKAGLGTVFVGEVADENTARYASAIFGKRHMKKVSSTYSRNDTSQSVSTQMEDLMPTNRIMNLNQGEFVGKVTETGNKRATLGTKDEKPDEKIFATKFMVDKDPGYIHKLPKVTVFDDSSEENDLLAMKDKLNSHMLELTREMEEIVEIEYWLAMLKKEIKTRQPALFIRMEMLRNFRIKLLPQVKAIQMAFQTKLVELNNEKKAKEEALAEFQIEAESLTT